MRKSLVPMVLWLPLLAGCASAPPRIAVTSCQQIEGKQTVQAELFFGRDIAGHGRVSDAQWSAFLRDEVTPRFPDGLTTLAASGQWRDTDTGRITREPSSIVRIVAPETPETLARLAEIRNAYKVRFRQQSVGLVLTPACASF